MYVAGADALSDADVAAPSPGQGRRGACYNTAAPIMHARATMSSTASQPGAVMGVARLAGLRRREVTVARTVNVA